MQVRSLCPEDDHTPDCRPCCACSIVRGIVRDVLPTPQPVPWSSEVRSKPFLSPGVYIGSTQLLSTDNRLALFLLDEHNACVANHTLTLARRRRAVLHLWLHDEKPREGRLCLHRGLDPASSSPDGIVWCHWAGKARSLHLSDAGDVSWVQHDGVSRHPVFGVQFCQRASWLTNVLIG